jgi:hypothetical protein
VARGSCCPLLRSSFRVAHKSGAGCGPAQPLTCQVLLTAFSNAKHKSTPATHRIEPPRAYSCDAPGRFSTRRVPCNNIHPKKCLDTDDQSTYQKVAKPLGLRRNRICCHQSIPARLRQTMTAIPHYSDMMRAPRKVCRERVHGHHLPSTGQTVPELLIL